MTTRTNDGAVDQADGAGGARYPYLRLTDGEGIIYDRTDEDAWIQSATAIGLEFMR
jgi:hypothetical protein